MEKFQPVKGRSIPMSRADVDTDQIISKEFLKRIEIGRLVPGHHNERPGLRESGSMRTQEIDASSGAVGTADGNLIGPGGKQLVERAH